MSSMKDDEFIFTVDWFSQNIPNLLHVLTPYKDKDNVHMLEIGSLQGLSTVWMLENILTHPTSKIDCVDTFEGSFEHADQHELIKNLYDVFKHNTKRYGDKVNIHRGMSQVVLRGLRPVPTYDIIYIDGDHLAPSVMEDGVLAFRLLKSGGIMIFDDYPWGKEIPEIRRPKFGIDAFMSVFQEQFDVLVANYQMIIRKK